MFKKIFILVLFLFLIVNVFAIPLNTDKNSNLLDTSWTSSGLGTWTGSLNNWQKLQVSSGTSTIQTNSFTIDISNWFFDINFQRNGSDPGSALHIMYAENESAGSKFTVRESNDASSNYELDVAWFNGTSWDILFSNSTKLFNGTNYLLEFGKYDGNVFLYVDGVLFGTKPYADKTITRFQILNNYGGGGTTYFRNIKYGNYLESSEYVINIIYPSTNDTISKVTDVNINFTDNNLEFTPKLKIYYSSTQGDFSNLIYSDINLLDGIGFVCDSYDFSTAQNCSYDWNTIPITDGNYFIDANAYNNDFNIIASGGEFEVNNTDLVANYSYTVNKNLSQVELIDSSSGTGTTISDWNWLVDTIKVSDLQDYNYVTTQNQDLNICLQVGGYDIATGLLWQESQNCQTILTGRWFGLLHITSIDETTNTLLDEVTMTFDGNTYTINKELWLDINFLGTTNQEKTIGFSKTSYGSRNYTNDFNRFTDLNISILMLPSTDGRTIEFQVYKTNQTTLYSNTFIELLNNNKDYNFAGRGQTDSSGKISFFLNPNDENYTLRIIDSPIIDYNSMTLTVKQPKNESTGLIISGVWDLSVTGLAWQSYTGITGDQPIQIYSNTTKEYGLTIGDDNADFFDRKYFISYLGGTTSETLQPYLVPITNAVSTTIFTVSGYTQQPIGEIKIKIYKTISGIGRVLVEQITTDAKGEALISLIANDEYEFEIFRNGIWINSKTYSVTSTSPAIYIGINDLSLIIPVIEQGIINVRFNPQKGRLNKLDTSLLQTISLIDKNFGLTFVSAFIYVTNTDINGISGQDANIYSKTIYTLINSINIDPTNQLLDGNWYDTNGYLIINVVVTTNKGTYYSKYKYKPLTGFDFYKAIGFDLRPSFGCSSTNDPLIPCGSMLFIAIFISLLGTVAFIIETGLSAKQGIVGIFLSLMGIFTYFGWVPIGLMALLVISVIMIMIAIGGRTTI